MSVPQESFKGGPRESQFADREYASSSPESLARIFVFEERRAGDNSAMNFNFDAALEAFMNFNFPSSR